MKRNTIFERALSLVLAGMLCLTLAAPAAAAETASTVRMMQSEGTVSVTNSRGRDITLLENLQLYNGYHVTTQASSYAWLNLDDTKLAKEDAASEVEIRKSGKKLELLVSAGNLYFNVTEPLKSDETMNIRTSTMVTGIRGTCGWVEAVDSGHSQVYVLEGKLDCRVTDPTTGQSKSASVRGGERADFYVYDQGLPGERCEIVTGTFSEDDVNGFVLMELAGDEGLCDRIYTGSGLDLRTRAASARARQAVDEAAMAQALSQSQELASGQASSVSKNPVWTGGGGGNTVQQSASADPGELSAQLADPSVDEVVIAGDSGVPETMVVDSELAVPAGKTLALGRDVDVEVQPGAVVTVAGTLHIQGNLTNNGVIDVTSGRTLRVEGQLANGRDGVIRNHGEGRIVAAEGILNSGVIINADQAEITSEAVATLRQQAGGTLQLTGGTVSNEGGGYALLKEGGLTPAEAKALAANQGGSFRAKTTNVFGSVDESGVYSTVRPEGWSAHIQGNGYYQVKEGSDGSDGGVTTVVETRTNTVYETETVYETIYETIYEPVYVDGEAAEITFEETTAPGENYYLSGWETSDGRNLKDLGSVSGNIAVYSQWSIIPNGGTTEPGEPDKYTITFAGKDETKEGHYISGWVTSDGTKLEDLENISENIVVTPQWTEIPKDSGSGTPASYTVAFNLNGGTKDGTDAAPTREGYTFLGWNTQQNGSGSWLTEDLKVKNNDMIYYAQWREGQTYNTGDFIVTGGEPGIDYAYSNDGVLTILTEEPLTIRNADSAQPTTDTIFVEKDINASITLASVNIDVSKNTKPAFKIADNSTGDVTITLASGSKNILTSGSGAGLEKSDVIDNAGQLTICGSGELIATGYGQGAGIGGSGFKYTTNITILGGKIKAVGGENGGAGIGGGAQRGGDYITISGGDITAQGGRNGGAGIGGGYAGAGTYITISGGVVRATGGDYGAGIGGGTGAKGENIAITNGCVEATGGEYGAAGIGGGGNSGGDALKITISGGEVEAHGTRSGAGIGGGGSALSDGEYITISAGIVRAYGGTDGYGRGGAGIGGGGYSGNGRNITISGGEITAQGGGTSGNRSAGIGGSKKGAGEIITIIEGTVRTTGTKNTFDSVEHSIGGGDEGNTNNIHLIGGTVDEHLYN